MTGAGHGGEGFLKFQDKTIISSDELGDSIKQMWQRQRCGPVCPHACVPLGVEEGKGEGSVRATFSRSGLRRCGLTASARTNLPFFVTAHSVCFVPRCSALFRFPWVSLWAPSARYREFLFIADTCHAESLLEYMTSPNTFGMTSSRRDQDSYSVHSSIPFPYLISLSSCSSYSPQLPTRLSATLSLIQITSCASYLPPCFHRFYAVDQVD